MGFLLGIEGLDLNPHNLESRRINLGEYYKFHCCRYWHVEWDSLFILVRLEPNESKKGS